MTFFRHIDDEFDFGKFKGLSLSDVIEISPDYIVWCMFNVTHTPFIISDEAMHELSVLYPKITFDYEFEKRRFSIFQEWMLKHENDDYYFDENASYDYYEEETYEHYCGSYAQDVEDWSDQEIDDVLDGDPDAYWNID